MILRCRPEHASVMVLDTCLCCCARALGAGHVFIEEHALAWHTWFVNVMTRAGHDVGLDAKRLFVCARVSKLTRLTKFLSKIEFSCV